jgi:hypothetical protein
MAKEGRMMGKPRPRRRRPAPKASAAHRAAKIALARYLERRRQMPVKQLAAACPSVGSRSNLYALANTGRPNVPHEEQLREFLRAGRLDVAEQLAALDAIENSLHSLENENRGDGNGVCTLCHTRKSQVYTEVQAA